MAKQKRRNPSAVTPLHAIARCTARSKRSGQRCHNPPMNGQHVCRMHGGATAASRAKAEQVILAGAYPSAAYLLETVYNEDALDAVRVKAATELLDRAGLTRKTNVEVTVAAPPWEQAIARIVAEVPDEEDEPRVIDVHPVPPPALPPAEVPYDTDDRPPPRYKSDWNDDEEPAPPPHSSPAVAERTPPPPTLTTPAAPGDEAVDVAGEKVPPRRLLDRPGWQRAVYVESEQREQYGEFSG